MLLFSQRICPTDLRRRMCWLTFKGGRIVAVFDWETLERLWQVMYYWHGGRVHVFDIDHEREPNGSYIGKI